MTNALDLALANAAANAPKGEELHLENLDAIANPEREEVILHQYDPNRVVVSEPPQYNPKDVAFRSQGEEDNYYPRLNPSKLTLDSIDYKLGEITNTVMHLNTKVDNISTIITKAASMSSEPNLKHRSLDEWGDSTLLNELVERENDLMPFYYELLKRIGSPELQSLVMSSMQGKNASMVTLAQLCSALAPKPAQPQPISGNTTLIPNNPVREKQKQAEALLNQNMLSEEQQNALSDEDYHNWAVYMNHLCEESTVMMRFPLTRNYEPIKWNRESVIPPQQVPPQQQYFGQATEEYIRQTNNRIAP